MLPIPNINSGGGSITPDLSTTAKSTGGSNSFGAFNVGSYNPPQAVKSAEAQSLAPWVMGGLVVVVLALVVLKK